MAPREPSPTELSVMNARGRHMGRFLVLGVLGRGGMGVVLEAHDAKLDRNVALKLLRSSAARRSEVRLLREAQALARLSHPNVVQIYDVGELDGQTFIAMELVRGRTLRTWSRDEARSWRATVEVYLQAARGLAAAHDKGLVHRDFKPENCIIDDDGRVRVLDFGLSRAATANEPEPDEPDEPVDTHQDSSNLLDESVTRTGVLLGTVAFMSFEQLQGRQADAQSDQFSFCASLYEALHGVGPYLGGDPVSLLTAMLMGTRRPVSAGVAVPRRLLRALWRGLSREPSRRWPSMHALIAELEALTGARRSRTMAAALGLSLGLGLVAATSFSREPADPCPDVATALAGTWDADARQRVERAFATYEPAGDTALVTRLVERLDDYATAWATMTRDSCEATFVTRRQSEAQLEHRTRCLERRRNRLVATISALTAAEDAQALTQAIVLPFRLPALDPCGEAALVGVDAAALDGPDDERHVALRRAIDEASTMHQAGRMDEAIALAEAALANARVLADPGLLGEALECLGRVQGDSGAVNEARATLEEAVMVANAAKDDSTAARAWVALLFATTMRGAYTEAEHHALAARAAVERDDDDVLRAWLLNNLGVLAAEQRRYALARERFEQALRLKQTALGAEHVDVGIAWQNLGTLLSDAGEPRDAIDALTQARTIFAATVGESHPWNAYLLTSSCQAEHSLGHPSSALELCEKALTHFNTYTSASLESRTRFLLAEILQDAGRNTEAIAMARRAIELDEAEGPNRSAWIERWTRWIASEERKQENRP